MIPLPSWVDAELFAEYVQQRKDDGKKMSPRSLKGRIERLYQLHDAGHDVNQSIEEALNGHWLDFYEPRDKTVNKVERRETAEDYLKRVAQERAAEAARVSGPSPEVREKMAQLGSGRLRRVA